MKHIPKSVLATLVLIGMNAVFWLGFAIVAVVGGIPGFDGGNTEKWMLAGLALGTAVCLAALVYFLARRKRIAFYAATISLAIILVLSITDQVGLWDLLTMLSILAVLVLLFKDRKWYLNESKDHAIGSQGGGDEI
jgi:hypothetical protein